MHRFRIVQTRSLMLLIRIKGPQSLPKCFFLFLQTTSTLTNIPLCDPACCRGYQQCRQGRKKGQSNKNVIFSHNALRYTTLYMSSESEKTAVEVPLLHGSRWFRCMPEPPSCCYRSILQSMCCHFSVFSAGPFSVSILSGLKMGHIEV